MIEAAPLPAGRKRSDAARRAILDAAYALVAERGYAGVTTAEIAARAGAGKQTIYRWWPGKSALVLDALDAWASRAGEPLEDAPLPALLEQVCRNATEAGPILRSLLGEAQGDPELRAALKERVFEPRRTALRRRLQEIGHAPGRACEATIAAIEGAIWYRLMLDEPLDEAFSDNLVCLAEAAV